MPKIEKDTSIIPLYKNDMMTAKENGEMADWRSSFKENCNCAKAIDKALNDNFADNHLDTDKALDTVVAEYGAERVTHVLAAQVVNHDWDGRYHNDVKTWAKEQTKELSAEFMEDSRDYYLNAHPILIDGLATKVMGREKELEKEPPKDPPDKTSEKDVTEPPKTFTKSKDKVKEITDKLESGIKELFEGEKFKEYLDTMSKFHNYSLNNTMLIAMQKPDATLVAGFNSWKNKFERNVNKGEKGIQIFAPAPYKIKKEQTKLDPDTDLPVLDKNGKPITEEVEVTIPAFKVVSVFDVSQTSGKELPTLGADELSGNVTDYEKFFNAVREASPVPIKFAEIDGTAKGFYHHEDKAITIKDNAGTEVTSDIIFLQKRDKMLDIEPDWVHLGQTEDGVPVNKYFEQHPEMILGEMKQGVEFSMYGNAEETACVPIKGASLKEQLKETIANIQGNIPEVEQENTEKVAESIPADPNVRNFSYAVVDDKLYFRENSRMFLKDNLPKATEERIKGMCELRDCVRTLIDYQLNEYSDYDIRSQQTELNRVYDDFTRKYGLINSVGNARAFSEDSSYYLLSSLEVLNENGELERKADMFTKRTIKQKAQVTSVDTASEALAVSISEKVRVDMPLMEQLAGKSEEQLINDLKGVIFRNPQNNQWETADEYLSGNIREKLEFAKKSAEVFDEDLSVNISALEKAMPKPLEASEIDVRLGATWLDTDIIKQFMIETLQVPRYLQNMFDVNFSKYTSEWNIEGKNVDRSNVAANMTYGLLTSRHSLL